MFGFGHSLQENAHIWKRLAQRLLDDAHGRLAVLPICRKGHKDSSHLEDKIKFESAAYCARERYEKGPS